MKEFRGKLADRPWIGWLCEREADLPEFMSWIRRQTETVAFDTEGTGLDIYTDGPGYLRYCQFGTETEAWAVPVELGPAFRQAATDALRILPSLCGHNVIQHDGQTIDLHLGVKLEEFVPKVTDTWITAKLIDPREEHAGGIGAGLKAQSAHFVDPSAPDTAAGLDALFKSLGYTKKSGLGWRNVPWDNPLYVEYGLLDTIMNARLLVAHKSEMKRLDVRQALVPYEHNLSRMAATMSRAGLLVDHEYTETLYGTLDTEREKYVSLAARYGVENVNSNTQVAEALVAMGETLTELTDGGQLKTDKAVLLPLADLTDKWERIGARTPNPVAEAILHAQRAGKWRSAYVDGFMNGADSNGRIHPNINTLQARTGRMSITRPAVQTLPSGDAMIRRCLLADEGHVMVSTDFAAVEMRVLAGMADVSRMKQAIRNGDDLHDYTATLVFGEGFTKHQRKIAKAIGFGKVFGGGAATVQRQTGAPMAEVQSAMATYDRVYPEVKRASQRWQREARWDGFVTRSATGRRLPLDRDRQYAVVNYRVQSTARDCLGQALHNMEAAGLLPYLRLPVHDEVLASVPKGEAREIAREFERCMTFDLFGVPIDTGDEGATIGGRSWGSLYGADF